MVRKLTGGSFANTAFCILAPDGETTLTRTGRGPHMVFRVDGKAIPGSEEAKQSNLVVYEKLEEIAAKYPAKKGDSVNILQDFDSFKQSLNIASSDQRLLVFSVSDSAHLTGLKSTLTDVASDPEVIGRYHFDIAGASDSSWASVIEGVSEKTGIFIIQSGEFGQEGELLTRLELKSNKQAIITALSAANERFAASEQRKEYKKHLMKGRQEGITYEDNMPYGEDRDGDGVIDKKPSRSPRR